MSGEEVWVMIGWFAAFYLVGLTTGIFIGWRQWGKTAGEVRQ